MLLYNWRRMSSYDVLPDTRLRHLLDVTPSTGEESHRLRRQYELTKFVSAYLESGSVEGTATALGTNLAYVRQQLKNPHILQIIRHHLEAKLWEAQITPGRLAMQLYDRLGVASDRDAASLGKTILEIMRFCRGDGQPETPQTAQQATKAIEIVYRELRPSEGQETL